MTEDSQETFFAALTVQPAQPPPAAKRFLTPFRASMPIPLPQLALVWTAVGLASVVQGTVGFASGLLMTPILIVAGWSLPEAIAINLVSGVAQNLVGAYQLRRSIEWPRWLRPNLVRLAGLPIGVWTLAQADRLDPSVVRQLVGTIILGVVAIFWFWRVRPREHLPVIWEYVAMGTSGFFAGFCGVGGPLIVLWLTAQIWPPARTRAFLFFAFSFTLLPHAALLIWNFDEKAISALQLGVLALPSALAGIAVGLVIGNRLPHELLRRLMLGILAAVAISTILMPLW
jgi:uncharacterized membrane protein YfcA